MSPHLQASLLKLSTRFQVQPGKTVQQGLWNALEQPALLLLLLRVLLRLLDLHLHAHASYSTTHKHVVLWVLPAMLHRAVCAGLPLAVIAAVRMLEWQWRLGSGHLQRPRQR